MSEKESISIIVPIYNAEKTLAKCIDSLRKQTITNIQIILVDDGSTDNSLKICEFYRDLDSRIKVIHKENGGAITARNTGIALLEDKGYTTFCDADDMLPRDGIEKLVELAVATNSDISCGTLQRFIFNHIHLKLNIPLSLKEKHLYIENEINNKLLSSFFGITDFPGYMPTKLYRNELLKESSNFICPVKHFQEDIAFNLQVILKARKIAVTPDVVYYYRMGGSTSKFMPEFLDDSIALYNFKVKIIEKNQLPEELRYATAVELKNECSFWLKMYFEYYHGNMNREKMLKEIKRCRKLPEIVEVINYPKSDFSGIKGFKELFSQEDYEGVYQLLRSIVKKERIKNVIRKIIAKL